MSDKVMTMLYMLSCTILFPPIHQPPCRSFALPPRQNNFQTPPPLSPTTLTLTTTLLPVLTNANFQRTNLLYEY